MASYDFKPFDVLQTFYQNMDELDEKLYPGYQMNLLEEAAGTTRADRVDTMRTAEVQRFFYEEILKDISHLSAQIFFATRSRNDALATTLLERKEKEEGILEEVKDFITGLISTAFEDEFERRDKIEEYIGI